MEHAFYIELVKSIGFPALIFIMWLIYFRADAKKGGRRIEQQVKQFEIQNQLLREFMERSLDNQKTIYEEQIDLLKEITETLQYQAACLVRTETKIDNNQFCPVVRKSSREAI